MKNQILAATVLLLSLSSVFALGQTHTTETGWLELVKGYKGSEVGAQMREVETHETTGEKTLKISIPKAAITHPSQVEEVVVVGQKPEERGPLFNLDFDVDFEYEFEWVQDYDKDNYGLVIRLGKNSNWPIRLFMYADDGPRN